jgi:hypothetical protein
MSALSNTLVLNDIVIESRSSDNFVNATQLCKAGGKRFNDWYRLDFTKELIRVLEEDLKLNTNIVDIKRGNSKLFTQGSWIHPQLATVLAQWISPKFAVKVSKWVEEWKEINNNKTVYFNELSKIEPSNSRKIEKDIQLRLKNELNAEMEIKTEAGYIDLMNEQYIIEIKEFSKWKHALGQILSYSAFYPDKVKRVYLFGKINSNLLPTIENIYSIHAIEIELISC